MKRVLALVGRHRAVVVGLIAQVLQYGAALLLLPFVVTRLPAAEVGIWYVFVTVQGLATLADFGFQPTIARGFAAAYAGADRLHREGLATVVEGAPNLALIAHILRAVRQLYLALAVVVLLVLLTGGTVYMTHLVQGQANAGQVRIAWVLFAIGTAANLYFLWVEPLLMGSGRVAQSYLLIILNRGGFALLGVAVLLAGGGLIALAGANLVAVLVARGGAAWSLRPMMRDLSAASSDADPTSSVLREIGPNAARMGLVALGSFMISRFNVLIVSSYVGLTASASYAISLQILGALTAAALLPSQVAMPRMVALRVSHNIRALGILFAQRHLVMLCIYTCGAVIIVLFGQSLLHLIGSKVSILPEKTLLILAIVLLLETNHGNCGYVIATSNRIPFVGAALLSGLGVVTLSWLAAGRGWGVAGVITAQGLIQLAYNNWKWPYMLWKELRP